MANQDEQAGRRLHAADPWQYHALTDRTPEPDGCCAEARRSYHCTRCGHVAETMTVQCPSCQRFDTLRVLNGGGYSVLVG